jgi:hypothetical protein
MDRRQFIKTAALGSAAAMVTWKFGGTLALAQLPDETSSIPPDRWEEIGLSRRYLIQKNEGIRSEAPCLAFDPEGTLWTTWVEDEVDGEQLYAATFGGTGFGEAQRVSEGGNGHVAHSRVKSTRRGVVALWTERQGWGHWNIALRRLGADSDPAPVRLDEPGIGWRPDIVELPNGALCLVYERRRPGARFEIVARLLRDGAWGEAVGVSGAPEEDCCRPAVTLDAQGRPWIAWDQTDGIGGPHVWIAPLEGSSVGTRVQVTRHPAENIAPALAHDGHRLWIAWQSNRRDEDEWDIPRWIHLRAWQDGEFFDPVGEMPGKDLTKRGTDQSFEFPRLYCGRDGRVVVTGRPSHNFCLQWYHGNRWSPLYRVPEDFWGGRGQFLEGAFDAAGNFWVARRDFRVNTLHCITGMQGAAAEPRLTPAVRSAAVVRVPSNAIRHRPNWDALEGLEGIDEPLIPYYGDLHGHTWISDGVGDIDEYYRLRRDYYRDDFASLTDHDTFVGKSILPSEWEQIKEVTQHWHGDDRFVTLFGQEYTTGRPPAGIGHKCIYSTDPTIPLFDHTTAEANTSAKLNALVKKWNALIFPHHTGWTGTDWEGADEEIQTLVEICSNHGRFEYPGNTPIPHRGGIRGGFVQDALARGLKFGLIGGSDSHGLIWHHRVGWKRDNNRTGLAVALAPRLTREAIFEALRRRRTYATTGIKPLLDFRINGHLMGEEISVPAGPITLTANVIGDVELKWIEIVRNNELWYSYGGEGWQSRITIRDDEVPPGTSWYYLRVEFESGDMAWSSPIWVTRQA